MLFPPHVALRPATGSLDGEQLLFAAEVNGQCASLRGEGRPVAGHQEANVIAESRHSLDRLEQRAGTVTVQVHCIAAIVRHLEVVDMQSHIANVHSPATHFTGSRHRIDRICQIRFIKESIHQNVTKPNRIRLRLSKWPCYRSHSGKTQTSSLRVYTNIRRQRLNLCHRRFLQRNNQPIDGLYRTLRRILSSNITGRSQHCRSKSQRGTHARQPRPPPRYSHSEAVCICQR